MAMSKSSVAQPKASYVPWYRTKIFVLFAGAAAVACVAGLGGLYLSSTKYLYIDDAMIQGDKISVSSRQPGKVSRLLVEEGSVVKKGQLLVSLDESEISAQKTQAETAMLLAEENMKLYTTGVGKAQNDLGRAQLQFKSGYIPTEQYEHAENQREVAEIQKSIAAAQAASARAQFNIVKTQMDEYSIYATDDGVVAKKWATEGDVIMPGQPLYTMYNLHTISVAANVEETKFTSIRLGQKALVTVDAYPNRTWTGKVVSSGPCAASQFVPVQSTSASGEFTKITQYVPVRIVLDSMANNDMAASTPLLPGMSVEVRLKGVDQL
jgi:membrane fusion protein (multidrug efflux system)